LRVSLYQAAEESTWDCVVESREDFSVPWGYDKEIVRCNH